MKRFFYVAGGVLIIALLIGGSVLASPASAPLFFDNPVLDDFNRSDGGLGSAWNDGASTSITSNQVVLDDVYLSSTNLIWNSGTYGVDQEAYITLNNISVFSGDTSFSLILKKQQSDTSVGDMLLIVYRHGAGHVQVYVVEGGSFADAKTPQSVTFANGDQFGAVVSGSSLDIYKNGSVVFTEDVSSYDYIGQPGYIGFRYYLHTGDAFSVDDFGGGTLAEPTPTPSSTSVFTATPTSTTTPSPTGTITPSPTPTGISWTPGEPQFDFWFRWLIGIIFLASRMYWQGLFFFFILPYLFAYNENVPAIIFISFFLFSVIRFYEWLGDSRKSGL